MYWKRVGTDSTWPIMMAIAMFGLLSIQDHVGSRYDSSELARDSNLPETWRSFLNEYGPAARVGLPQAK